MSKDKLELFEKWRDKQMLMRHSVRNGLASILLTLDELRDFIEMDDDTEEIIGRVNTEVKKMSRSLDDWQSGETETFQLIKESIVSGS